VNIYINFFFVLQKEAASKELAYQNIY